MKKLLLIDANSLIHRAFHALPPLTTPAGEPIGAIYGLANTLLKIIREQKPDYIAAAFDRPEPTFRDELFKNYKAHRPKTAEELVGQISKARELFKEFNVSFFEKAGFEADDIIATIVKKFRKEKDLQIIVLTGDLDTLQLVENDKIIVQTPKKGISETMIYDEKAVLERYGLKPEQLNDYKGLVGDKSDNIPGVPGIGPKTASKLIQKYGSLEKLFERIKINDRLSEKLLNNKDLAFLSKKLVVLHTETHSEISLKDLTFVLPEKEKITKYFAELGFQSLIKRSWEGWVKDSAETKPETNQQKIIIVSGADFCLEHERILESEELKVAFGWKNILKELARHKKEIKGPLFDVEIAGWLIDSGQKNLSPESLGEKFLFERSPGQNRESLISKLYGLFEQKIKEYGLEFVFNQIEMPLVPILAAMEKWGAGINIVTLKNLEKEINKELEELAEKIYREAETVFNINSSRQVGQIIFDKLGVKPLKTKKTSTGLKSTAVGVLKNLENKHPIIGLILNYRENFKIKSTFIEPLIELMDADGRIRTNFIQTGTATGRLASEKPNLQNLPQESKWSKGFREAFEPPNGSSFLALDYSQLELRLLAHVSQDQKLQKAFLNDIDAHRVTASQVFNVPLEGVTREMRRVGKTLNFGVIYGMGPRAFAEVSGFPIEEADEFIEEYFRDFPDVRKWQDKIKGEAKTFGYVKNENGRRRWFLKALSDSPRAEAEFERAAINMPIQSLGADIIKLAMIKSFEVLALRNWLGDKVKLILTIHDELLFEVSDDILKSVAALLKKIMEDVYRLSVPLKVEVKSGKNLGELYEKQNNNNI